MTLLAERHTHTNGRERVRDNRDEMDIDVHVCEAGHLAKVRRETSWENAGHFFDVIDLETALDTSVLSLYAIDKEADKVVGFLALEVAPSSGDVVDNPPIGEWIRAEMETLGFHAGGNLWINVACLSKKHGKEALEKMLKFAFSKFTHINSIAFSVVNRDYLPHKAYETVIPKISESKDLRVSLRCIERGVICPKMVVRPAKVEDHDDLVPVVEEMRSNFADLSELPDSVKPGEKFALARLIENDSWSVLVATVKEKIVGMMCLQEIEDLDYYQENFDLEIFDNLASFTEAEAQPAEESKEETETSASDDPTPEADAAAEVTEDQADGGSGEGADGDAAAGDGGAAPAEAADAGKAASAGSEAEAGSEDPEAEATQEDQDFDFTDDEEDGEEENAKEEENGEAAPEVKRESLAFAVKMFCMKDEYAHQAIDFLQPAFDTFPTKDYCIVTLSHSSRVPSLLLPFSQATAATQKLSSDVLYVLHRYSLLTDFAAEKAVKKDYNEILELLGDLAEEKEILDSINTALDAGHLMKATCQDQIVGVCSVNPEVEITELMMNFQLPAFSDTLAYRSYKFGELTTFVMNPVFAYQKKFFLSCVMRDCAKTSLCFFLKETKPIADILDVFEPVPKRKTRESLEEDGEAKGIDYALFVLNQRDVYKEKDPMNARVIVVGASKCGLSCLEKLLQSPQYQFTSLTLVTSDQSESSAVTRLANEHAFLSQVRLISSAVVEIDREAKQVYLENETILSYDILVLTSGVQDQINFSLDEAPLPVVSASKLKTYLHSLESKPKHAIVYGGQGEAFDAMSMLVDQGIDYTYASPETSTKMKLVEHVAKEVGIDMFLRKASRMTLHGVFAGSSDAAPVVCSFVNTDGGILKAETSLLVLAHTQNVNPHIFGCLNDSSIVYDGRLVVNGNFCTTDEFIFGGGTLAKFSRLYRGNHIETLNSNEVGEMLAANITDKCKQANAVSKGETETAPAASDGAPLFKEPIGFSLRLPHEKTYLTYISNPPWIT